MTNINFSRCLLELLLNKYVVNSEPVAKQDYIDLFGSISKTKVSILKSSGTAVSPFQMSCLYPPTIAVISGCYILT